MTVCYLRSYTDVGYVRTEFQSTSSCQIFLLMAVVFSDRRRSIPLFEIKWVMNISFLAQQRKSFLLTPYIVFGRWNFIQEIQTEETYHSREGHELRMCESIVLRMSVPKRERQTISTRRQGILSNEELYNSNNSRNITKW